jgi:hypothetical protein
VQDQALLKSTISGLARLRGKERIEQWNRLIDQENWSEFLQSILLDHYDLVYRRPGSEESVYQTPEKTLTPSSSNQGDFEQMATELIAHYQSA